MIGAAFFYGGVVALLLGLGLVIRPVASLRVRTRRRALLVTAIALAAAICALAAPAFESRVSRAASRLDEVTPAWQFHEVHRIRIEAPAARVFDALRQVRADEIFLFRTLTWIRRGGRPLQQTILDAGSREPLIDVATHTSFVVLADEGPRELVIGTIIAAPPGTHGKLTPRVFQVSLPPGFVLATMNFLVTPDGPDACYLSTETRVFANEASVRRRFAVYWRMIYPGSALIRRMWLRAIERRATT